jgi:septal ring factor EnvC (AmiA/AmiB activator)
MRSILYRRAKCVLASAMPADVLCLSYTSCAGASVRSMGSSASWYCTDTSGSSTLLAYRDEGSDSYSVAVAMLADAVRTDALANEHLTKMKAMRAEAQQLLQQADKILRLRTEIVTSQGERIISQGASIKIQESRVRVLEEISAQRQEYIDKLKTIAEEQSRVIARLERVLEAREKLDKPS